MEKKEYDIESGKRYGAPVIEDEFGAVHGESFAAGDTVYAKLQSFAGKLGVEQRGIERVPEDERTDMNLWKIATMWCSSNMVVSALAIGVLGPIVFFTGFVDGVLTIFFINVLGILPVCYYSAFGPRFGLRQMVLSRYYFGYNGVKLIAFFNVLACLGWSATNTIVGAQLINTVNPGVPGWAGIIIIAACTFVVTVFGYRIVHLYEGWSWIPMLIIFMIALGEFAHSGAFNNIPMAVGASGIGSILSFSATIFGYATGWTSYAADYTVYQPVNVSRTRCFLWTFIGLIFPLTFVEMLGLAIATAYVEGDTSNPFTVGYDTSGVGGILGTVMAPLGGFGQFCLVILALSIIANNCPNIYSMGLSLQIMSHYSQRIPRFIWTVFGTLVFVAVAIPGYDHFEVYLEDFMNLIGYWLAIYEGIALSEHFLFKRGMDNYDVTIHNTPHLLPPGIAAVSAFLFGVLGAVMGMSQVWFKGPIALLIGEPPYGGDIGFELAFCFSTSTYILFRTIELRVMKR